MAGSDVSFEDRPIVIVGAGYSGTVTAVRLLRDAAAPRVVLVERRGVFARGLAYCHHDDNQLLNVPAGNMSALAGEPDHFVAFCQQIDPAFNAGSFVSRRLYGDYLQQTLADAEREAHGRLRRVRADVVAARRDGEGFVLELADGDRIAASQVVLALGHFAPRDPLPAPGMGAFGRCIAEPWDLAGLDMLPRDRPVLVLGSGHTAIDVLFRLCGAAVARRVLLVSRRGLLPQGHRSPPRAPFAGSADDVPAWLARVPPTLRALMRALRAEAALREAEGGDWRDVMNELRPHTPALWQRLPLQERRRFLARALPYWDVHRHRLAPAARRRLDGLLAGGAVECAAARIIDLRALEDGGVEVTLRHRGSVRRETRVFGAVVNCTGPGADLDTVASPLLRQLHADGLIRPDRLRLGLDVDPGYRVVDAEGQPVPGLHYLGPMLKARDWEAVAVPELRMHAQRLAGVLIAAVRLEALAV